MSDFLLTILDYFGRTILYSLVDERQMTKLVCLEAWFDACWDCYCYMGAWIEHLIEVGHSSGEKHVKMMSYPYEELDLGMMTTPAYLYVKQVACPSVRLVGYLSVKLMACFLEMTWSSLEPSVLTVKSLALCSYWLETWGCCSVAVCYSQRKT